MKCIKHTNKSHHRRYSYAPGKKATYRIKKKSISYIIFMHIFCNISSRHWGGQPNGVLTGALITGWDTAGTANVTGSWQQEDAASCRAQWPASARPSLWDCWPSGAGKRSRATLRRSLVLPEAQQRESEHWALYQTPAPRSAGRWAKITNSAPFFEIPLGYVVLSPSRADHPAYNIIYIKFCSIFYISAPG